METCGGWPRCPPNKIEVGLKPVGELIENRPVKEAKSITIQAPATDERDLPSEMGVRTDPKKNDPL